ncbi:tyrosine-type recombinase/integrase [Actinoallomurus acanthiterrae]
MDVWLVAHRMEANTRQGYTSVIKGYLLPEFGAMRMIETLPSHVRDFLRRLTDSGRSATTVQRCKTVLSSIFTTALNDQVIFLHRGPAPAPARLPCRDVGHGQMTVERSKARPPCRVSGLLTRPNVVGDTGIEPVTSTVSKGIRWFS